MRNQPITLNVITGFLGAGKTTFLNQYIKQHKDRKLGVIVNEFGKTSIDGPLIQTASGIDLREINNGSIFCKCRMLEFAQALIEMEKMDLNGVVVEASGLADPANLGDIFKAVMVQTNYAYTFNGSICLVDAVNFLNLSSALPALENQVRYSQIIVINKCDLVEDETLSAVKQAIDVLNPYARVYETSYGNIPMDFDEVDIEKSAPSSNTEWNRPKTTVMTPPRDITKQTLDALINSIKEQAYRAKGFITIENQKYYLDMVGNMCSIEPTGAKQEDQIVLLSIDAKANDAFECE